MQVPLTGALKTSAGVPSILDIPSIAKEENLEGDHDEER